MFKYMKLIGFRCLTFLENYLQFPKSDFGFSPIIVSSQSNQSLTTNVSDLFNSILWAAVPKNRRSREKRATRRFGQHKIREFMTPKTNIVECLECGFYHESHTICGNCYKKVKDETEFLKSLIPEANKYQPQKHEIEYRYKGEHIETIKINDNTEIIQNLPSNGDMETASHNEINILDGEVNVLKNIDRDDIIIEVQKERPSWFPKKLLSKYDIKN